MHFFFKLLLTFAAIAFCNYDFSEKSILYSLTYTSSILFTLDVMVKAFFYYLISQAH